MMTADRRLARLRARVLALEETAAALVEATQSLTSVVEQATENQARMIAALLQLKIDLGYRDPPPSLKLVGTGEVEGEGRATVR